MEPKEFILKVIDSYVEARRSVFKDKKIHRGRSHTISSLAEDLLAYYLIKNDPNIEKIYVDQSVYFPDSKTRIYPDITIIKNRQIVAFVDLKMDMGWNRGELLNLCIRHSNTIKQVRSKECRVKDGQTKDTCSENASQDISYSIVIIGRRNSGKQLDSLREQAKSTVFPVVDTFLLCDSEKYHPNEYGIDREKLAEGLDINISEFNRLLNKISQSV